MESENIHQLRQRIQQLEARLAEKKSLELRYKQALRSLHQSERQYRTVFENTGTATFVKEPDMVLSMVNTGFTLLTGYTREEVEGRMKWTDFIHEPDRDRLVGYHSQRRRHMETPKEIECRIIDKFGNVKEVFLKLDMVPGTQTSIGSMIDMSQLKQAHDEIHENKALLRAIVEGFEGFLYVVTHDFRLAYMNYQCIRHIGRDATGEVCHKAIHGRDTLCPFCVHDQVQKGESIRFEMKNPQDNRWYSSVNSPIYHADGTISLLALVRDIHQRKQAESALKEAEINLRKENIFLRSRIKERHKFGNIVGKSPAMQAVYEQILNAASTDATVIVYGEPGTGKELVAHAIHDMSERRNYRFVPVHCGAIPENLTESEFFGYKKGAFSGAVADKPGYVDYADKGTLFLDEIGEISLHMQVNLLRVIEGGGYTPVGSNQVKYSDIRIIAATNRDLMERIEKRMMRQDFYYRIHILPIYLPPLRERKEDLPLLVEHFMVLHGHKRNVPPITGKMMDRLMAYDWPGNVRELQNVMIRYCSLKQLDLSNTGRSPKPATSSAISVPAPGTPPSDKTLKERMEAHERQIILAALEQHRWHRGRTAKALAVDRKTLFSKMKRYGLLE